MLIFNRWSKLDRTEQKDFVDYLKILVAKDMVTENQKRLLTVVCIPALENTDGEINEDVACNEVGKYGFRIYQLNDFLENRYQELVSPVNAKKAAQYMGLSVDYVRRLARRGIPHLEAKKHPKGWLINLVSVNDWLIRHHKVSLA